MKRFLSMVLVLIMLMGSMVTVQAAPLDYPTYTTLEDAYNVIYSNFMQGQRETVFYFGYAWSEFEIINDLAACMEISPDFEFDFSGVQIDDSEKLITIKVKPHKYNQVNYSNEEILLAKGIIAKIITASMSESDKAKAIFDWLKLNVKYDEAVSENLDIYRMGLDVDYNEVDSAVYTAYGALNNGIAVCSGYAKAYQLLCREAELQCFLVNNIAPLTSISKISKSSSKLVPHAWNIVVVDGDWFFVDSTGTTEKITNSSEISYNKFLKKKEMWHITTGRIEYILMAKGTLPLLTGETKKREILSYVEENHIKVVTSKRPDELQQKTNIEKPVKYTPPIGNRYFSDWAYTEIKNSSIAPITDAAGSNYQAPMTRIAFCESLLSAFGAIKADFSHSQPSRENIFMDTASLAAHKLAKAGIISGIGNGMFNPYGTITREEAAKMLSNAAKYMGYDITGHTSKFADNDKISNWAKSDVGFISAKGIMNGVGDNKFDPKGVYTVEQSVVSISRLFKLPVLSDIEYKPIVLTWRDAAKTDIEDILGTFVDLNISLAALYVVLTEDGDYYVQNTTDPLNYNINDFALGGILYFNGEMLSDEKINAFIDSNAEYLKILYSWADGMVIDR